MSGSTVPSTSPAPKTRRRRPAGEVVLGVDTHRDAHVASVLSVTGAVLATDEFPASAAGYRDLLKWARKSGAVRRAGVEGTGSYGASLSRYLLAQGVDVFDVNWMDRADRRRRGKSDPLDAQNAARAVLSGRASARAKTGDGPVQIARMYKLTKASAVKARTQAINQLKAVLVTARTPSCGRNCRTGQCRTLPYLRTVPPMRVVARRPARSQCGGHPDHAGCLAGPPDRPALRGGPRTCEARLTPACGNGMPRSCSTWWDGARTRRSRC
ncbi:IS110 family transposase [Streptomyces violaceus]|uniref:IS110 family transposase n=1 Tax=Streptomyces violaceus TaxID=1936 RepID=UPI0031EB1DC1